MMVVLGPHTKTFGCHWDWCRSTFTSHQDLLDHVVQSHIQSATPVKRKDVPLLRRVEEGASGYTDSLFAGLSTQTEAQSQSQNNPQALEVTAVLPFPARDVSVPAVAPRTEPNDAGPFVSFAALSSRTRSPPVPSIPPSPSLANLVERAVNSSSSSSYLGGSLQARNSLIPGSSQSPSVLSPSQAQIRRSFPERGDQNNYIRGRREAVSSSLRSVTHQNIGEPHNIANDSNRSSRDVDAQLSQSPSVSPARPGQSSPSPQLRPDQGPASQAEEQEQGGSRPLLTGDPSSSSPQLRTQAPYHTQDLSSLETVQNGSQIQPDRTSPHVNGHALHPFEFRSGSLRVLSLNSLDVQGTGNQPALEETPPAREAEGSESWSQIQSQATSNESLRLQLQT